MIVDWGCLLELLVVVDGWSCLLNFMAGAVGCGWWLLLSAAVAKYSAPTILRGNLTRGYRNSNSAQILRAILQAGR